MTRRSHTLVFTLALAATSMLFPSTARLQEKTEPAASAQDSRIYIITQGDTLWDIANSELKDPFLWPLIWKENPFITNPDLIYPGDKLVIPSLAPLERAMQAPAETVPAPPERLEKTDTATPPVTAPTASTSETPAEPVAAPAPAVRRPPAAAAPVQEEEPVKRGLILDKETVRPLIDKYTMLSAGYLSREQWAESITGSLVPKAMFGFDDIVFILSLIHI